MTARTTPDSLLCSLPSLPCVLQDLKVMLPKADPVQLIRQSPDLVLRTMKGKHLVPYDQLQNPFT